MFLKELMYKFIELRLNKTAKLIYLTEFSVNDLYPKL